MMMPGTIITSRQNPAVVELCKLDDKKYRNESRQFRFDGFKLLEEALKRGVSVRTLYFRTGVSVPPRMEKAVDACIRDSSCQVYALSEDLFDRISDEHAPEGVITVADYIDNHHFRAIIKEDGILQKVLQDVPADRPVLFLETIQDPQNFGALIRSASAFGAGAVICSQDCADYYHPKALRAAMGAIFNMPILTVPELADAIRQARSDGRRVFAATLTDRSVKLGSFGVVPGDCVVIGNEGHGLKKDTVDASDAAVLIPMEPMAESLNAAVAGGVILWEFRHR